MYILYTNQLERRKIFVYRIDEQWQADLVDMQLYSKENEGYNYMLTVIDCFSAFAFCDCWKVVEQHRSSANKCIYN